VRRVARALAAVLAVVVLGSLALLSVWLRPYVVARFRGAGANLRGAALLHAPCPRLADPSIGSHWRHPMTAAPKSFLTPEEYLAREREAEIKSEYYDGETFAMAGGSEEHSLIAVNVAGTLNSRLADRPCKVYNSDMRVQVEAEGPYAYPDVSVVCGEAEFADEKKDTLVNPTVIVEVLSPTTEAWDRGGKFERYQQRASLQEYVLIAQDRPRVERYRRHGDAEWLLTVAVGLEARLTLASIGCDLALVEIYRKVAFPEEPPVSSGKPH
jgi:Uma2 family endonuclease